MLRRNIVVGDTGLYIVVDVHDNEWHRSIEKVIAINDNGAMLSNYKIVTKVAYQLDNGDEFSYELEDTKNVIFFNKELNDEYNYGNVFTFDE